MCHTSPSSYLTWAVLSSMLGIFLVYHLYSFDKFKCLNTSGGILDYGISPQPSDRRWNTGPYSGAFKRIMTYSYLFSVPLIITYAVGFTIIKYEEGYVFLELEGVLPKPYELWSSRSQSFIFPLTLCFACAWALEMVTHLEELCFWLFLINSNTGKQDWFRSYYFKTWICGTLIAVIYMPLVTIFTRENPLRSEAFTFLAGSLGSFSLTLWFMPILWTFPSFLNNLRAEGVDTATIVRLTKFHELNTIRVICRCLFTVPLLILGVDGVRPHQHINESLFWTDFLTFIAAIGCIVSSAITLIIFFPRSVEGEIAARNASRDRRRLRYTQGTSIMQIRGTADFGVSRPTSYSNHTYDPSAVKTRHSLHSQEYPSDSQVVLTPLSDDKSIVGEEYPLDTLAKIPAIRPNRKIGDDVELGGIGFSTAEGLTEANLLRLDRSSVNPLIHAYTSPIDMVYAVNARSEVSRLTFTRR